MKTGRGGLMLVAVLLGLTWGPVCGQAAWGAAGAALAGPPGDLSAPADRPG